MILLTTEIFLIVDLSDFIGTEVVKGQQIMHMSHT